MLENELFKEIFAVLNAGLIARGFPDIIAAQNYQPTNQGIPSKSALYVFKIGPDKRIGHVERKDEWVFADPPTIPTAFMRHTETQWYETDFQISATAIQNPKSTTPLTATDIANMAAGIMQSDVTLNALREKGIGILRIRDISNPFFMDDKNRFESNPSFDFTLTHEQVIISSVPIVETTEFQIKRV